MAKRPSPSSAAPALALAALARSQRPWRPLLRHARVTERGAAPQQFPRRWTALATLINLNANLRRRIRNESEACGFPYLPGRIPFPGFIKSSRQLFLSRASSVVVTNMTPSLFSTLLIQTSHPSISHSRFRLYKFSAERSVVVLGLMLQFPELLDPLPVFLKYAPSEFISSIENKIVPPSHRCTEWR